MTVVSFSTADELSKYVADNTIAQSAIHTILVKDGQWYIFHF